VLDGLKLIGFSVWERRSGGARNVTFPARQYSVNGERRSFALLRPIADTSAENRVRDLVLQAYAEYEETATEAASALARIDPGLLGRSGPRIAAPREPVSGSRGELTLPQLPQNRTCGPHIRLFGTSESANSIA
jgi:hypothetical protein